MIVSQANRALLKAGMNCLSGGTSRRHVSKKIKQLMNFQRWNSTKTIKIGDQVYAVDNWTNVTPQILSFLPHKLHLEQSHPLSITRTLIESQFPQPTYETYNNLSPIVSTFQNFDSLGFPKDHPGRSKSDTYYINENIALRTHSSAHQFDAFRKNKKAGFLISADVYRRDAIDKSHYPVFHQMEGARMWDFKDPAEQTMTLESIEKEIKLLKGDINNGMIIIEDPNPAFHPQRNPLQEHHHTPEQVNLISSHLKRSLERVVLEIFSQASRAASGALSSSPPLLDMKQEPLQVRWVETYFPFTSPSWELEVLHQGNWLELLGCGIVQQHLPINAGIPSHAGWAFGLGLERIAMLLFGIPDIRLFWSKDTRFLKQFTHGKITLFHSFSKYPAAVRSIAFWVPGDFAVTTEVLTHEKEVDGGDQWTLASPSGGLRGEAAATAEVKQNQGVDEEDNKEEKKTFHINDVFEVIRNVAGDLSEDVTLTDEWTHPETGRRSLCYNITYRSLERTLTKKEITKLHNEVRDSLVQKLGVELR